MDTNVKRGDIFYADLSPVVGSEQGGCRPVLIVQNDTGNKHSPTVIAAAITSQTGKARLPTHISLTGHDVGLTKDSVVLLEQIRTIDKRRLREHTGHADRSVMEQVDSALAVSFGLQGSRAAAWNMEKHLLHIVCRRCFYAFISDHRRPRGTLPGRAGRPVLERQRRMQQGLGLSPSV